MVEEKIKRYRSVGEWGGDGCEGIFSLSVRICPGGGEGVGE